MRARRSVQEFNSFVVERSPIETQGLLPGMQHHLVNGTWQTIEGQSHRLEDIEEPPSNDDNEREIFDLSMAFMRTWAGFG